MKQLFKKRVAAWSLTVLPLFLTFLALSSFLQGCGINLEDIDSETNRKAMIQDAINSLNKGDCPNAVRIANKLYGSKYSDNEIRMLYVSAQSCVTGISFYQMLVDIPANNFTTLNEIFKSVVKIFPSRTALDSRLQGAWNSQDALQSVLNNGAVVAQTDLTYGGTFNPGSARYIDRTQNSNLFLIFVGMAELGAGLNRYGYTAAQDPATLLYAQGTNLLWITKALVKTDPTGAACGLASSFYNLMDGINASGAIMPSSMASTLNTMLGIFVGAIDAAANAQCTADGFNVTACEAAILRLRYRGACAEQDAAASAAAGIIQAINAGWI